MIFRKIFRNVAIRCQILRLESIKFDFGWGSAPNSAEGAYSALPDALAAFRGPTSKGKGEGRREEREGRRREGRREGVWRKRVVWAPKIHYRLTSQVS